MKYLWINQTYYVVQSGMAKLTPRQDVELWKSWPLRTTSSSFRQIWWPGNSTKCLVCNHCLWREPCMPFHKPLRPPKKGGGCEFWRPGCWLFSASDLWFKSMLLQWFYYILLLIPLYTQTQCAFNDTLHCLESTPPGLFAKEVCWGSWKSRQGWWSCQNRDGLMTSGPYEVSQHIIK